MKIESENVWQSWSYLKKLKFIILSSLFKKEKEQWHKFANKLTAWGIEHDATYILSSFKESTYKWWYLEDPKCTFNISWIPVKPIERIKFVCTVKENRDAIDERNNT